MYLAVNLPHHIATLGDVLLLTASHMVSQILKCTRSPPPPPDALVCPSDP